MEISEVRVKLVSNKDDRLKAFCSVTMDNEFVVRDIKIIEGTNGLFVAMPSRKMSDHCPKCGSKNHLRARYCNNCGTRLPEERMRKDAKGRLKLHADIAHPINTECRRKIQDKVTKAYNEEVEKSKEPGYKPPELDTPDDEEVPEII
jgi:stage V sporulation protein G